MKRLTSTVALLLSILLLLSGCSTSETPIVENKNTITQNEIIETVEPSSVSDETNVKTEQEPPQTTVTKFDLSSIPAYSGKAYAAVNNNIPYFTENEHRTNSFEQYAPLDSLGRCGVAFANIGTDIMPTEERGSIGMIKPTGWHTVKYDNVDGKYLYNRCHLIGYQLSGENANEQNLITGTRYMNVDGMLPFENMVAAYVEETDNHVLYRVTPIFDGNNLLASGVLMEALSMEDNGTGICFNVFCYNVQPGIKIDYANGNSESESQPEKETTPVVVAPKEETQTEPSAPTTTYIANKNTKKFHYPYCHSVDQMKEKNKRYLTCTRSEAISQGYSPCGNCNP